MKGTLNQHGTPSELSYNPWLYSNPLGHECASTPIPLDTLLVREVSMQSGALLFYNSYTGLGATGRLDANGNYQFVKTIPGFATDWTHIVGR